MDQNGNPLGSYLKERRARLDPLAFGFTQSRRRTPGLRREEVAQLAHVSATWYTWLEQGRGGAPSADVLDRLALALALTVEEREHLYLLAQDRPPKVRRPDRSDVTPQLQRVLDSLEDTPAVVKTPEWTVIGWNRAATAVLADFPNVSEPQRNLLRNLFGSKDRSKLPDWSDVARLVVGTVRRDVMRAGMRAETQALIDELCRSSTEFRTLWAEQDVKVHGEGVKRVRHPEAGIVCLEYSTFAIDGRPDLALVIFNPATGDDRDRVRMLTRR